MSWESVPLAREVKLLSGGTPKKGVSQYWDGDIPWVSSGEMTQTHLFDTELHVTEEGAKNGTRKVPEDTVLIVVRGMSLAKEFRVSITQRPMTFNQDLKALQPSRKVDPYFLYYYLRSQAREIRDSSTEASHGTKKLESHIIEAWPLPLPPRRTQQAIVDILSAYDNLIENNRRRIQLLEQATRLLYKEWFVHLRFPGHEHLKVKNGVPEGWEKKKISDVCQTVGGGTPSTKVSEYWDGDVTWVVPSDITKNDCLALLGSERTITEKGLRESSARMVPANTILMTSRASVGYFAVMDIDVCTNQGFINIIPNDEEFRMYLLFNLMNRVEEIRSNAKGTTYPEISKGRFRDMDITVPTSTLIAEFSRPSWDVIQQIRILKKSIDRLETGRDLLLPRLMSGEVAA